MISFGNKKKKEEKREKANRLRGVVGWGPYQRLLDGALWGFLWPYSGEKLAYLKKTTIRTTTENKK